MKTKTNSLYEIRAIITDTAQKTKFSIKDFFSKCDQICSFLRIWSHFLKTSLMKNFIFLCSAKYTISKRMNLKRKNSSIFVLIKSFELLVLMIVLWVFIFQVERKEKIEYFQSYQINLLNHLKHLNLIAIEKASQNEYHYLLTHFCSLWAFSSSSEGKSNASNFVVLERRKTAEHAKLLTDQVEERPKRKLKILKKSLDLEKEQT